MGAAYRANGRAAPIMDAFSFHPYMLRSDEPPATTHSDTTITIADYPKLVAILGQAFDGTGQKGSTLPIVYDEFGVESHDRRRRRPALHRQRAATVHPVDEATQALYYAQALQLAFCQPNVQAFLVFSLLDENAPPGWQSGVYYADGTPKSSLRGGARRPPTPSAATRSRARASRSRRGSASAGSRSGRPTGRAEHVPDLAHVRRRLRLPRPDRAGGDARDDALGERPRDRPRADDGRVPADAAAAGELPDHGLGEGGDRSVGPPATAAGPVFAVPRQQLLCSVRPETRYAESDGLRAG